MNDPGLPVGSENNSTMLAACKAAISQLGPHLQAGMPKV